MAENANVLDRALMKAGYVSERLEALRLELSCIKDRVDITQQVYSDCWHEFESLKTYLTLLRESLEE